MRIHRENFFEQMRQRNRDGPGTRTEIEQPAGPVESKILAQKTDEALADTSDGTASSTTRSPRKCSGRTFRFRSRAGKRHCAMRSGACRFEAAVAQEADQRRGRFLPPARPASDDGAEPPLESAARRPPPSAQSKAESPAHHHYMLRQRTIAFVSANPITLSTAL